ncbi:DUF3011 domain-containing protein [Paracoccus pantotrophus]|uniref:DUF3011 domain-containing protein n=1 Tax=Paracoccus pantotrophus TaxID=82367 RepID=UPI00210BDFD2|nr:DUF3011 domain-containing protein [Paracoccus pantotrophus]MDF3856610.1 DUF3011 domain-containing protein [Paracoccus pantotrophus]
MEMLRKKSASLVRRDLIARYAIIALFGAGINIAAAAPVMAETTVECHSRNHKYDECWAGPLKKPQLIHQISNASCILNKTWGYNPKSQYIWVAQGCAGVFADVAGYHHGRGGGHDANARAYDDHGHDVGAVVGAAVIGALVGSMTSDEHNHRGHAHTTTNNYYEANVYSGCHGIGCYVDNPNADDEIDPRPQFDAQGEPNFDEDGNYQGCHGMGCLVDDPDE